MKNHWLDQKADRKKKELEAHESYHFTIDCFNGTIPSDVLITGGSTLRISSGTS